MAALAKSKRSTIGSGFAKSNAVLILDKLQPKKAEPTGKLSKLAELRRSKMSGKSTKTEPQPAASLPAEEPAAPVFVPRPLSPELLQLFRLPTSTGLLAQKSLSVLSLSIEPATLEDKLSRYSEYLYSVYFPLEAVTNHTIVTKAGKVKATFDKPKPKPAAPVQKLTSALSGLAVKSKPAKPVSLTDIPTLSFAVIGHVDAGKSTLMGMFLKQLNKVDKTFLRRLEDESAKLGKKSFALAWVMDQTTEERARGVTVDICTTSVSTSRANFIIIDAPGHKDYVPRMISGVSQADLGLLIIDIAGFEAGFSYDGQTKEHALLTYCLGIRKLVVVINKMDLVQYSEDAFNEVKERLLEFLVRDVGYAAGDLTFVPVSGIDGTNITKKPTEKNLTSWYAGRTLLEILEQLAVAPQEPAKEKFVFQVLDINDDFHQLSQFSLVGRVNSGVVQPGDTVNVSPADILLAVDTIKTMESTSGKEIEAYKQKSHAAKYDNNVSLFFKNKKVKEELKTNLDLIKPGDLLTSADHRIVPTNKFTAEIKLYDLRGQPLLPGGKFMLHAGANEVPAELSKFILSKGKKRVLHLGSNKSAVVEITLIDESTKNPRQLPLVTYEQDKRLGTVVLRKNGLTIGSGHVLQTNIQ